MIDKPKSLREISAATLVPRDAPPTITEAEVRAQRANGRKFLADCAASIRRIEEKPHA